MNHSELMAELNRIADKLLAIQEALNGAAEMVRTGDSSKTASWIISRAGADFLETGKHLKAIAGEELEIVSSANPAEAF